MAPRQMQQPMDGTVLEEFAAHGIFSRLVHANTFTKGHYWMSRVLLDEDDDTPAPADRRTG